MEKSLKTHVKDFYASIPSYLTEEEAKKHAPEIFCEEIVEDGVKKTLFFCRKCGCEFVKERVSSFRHLHTETSFYREKCACGAETITYGSTTLQLYVVRTVENGFDAAAMQVSYHIDRKDMSYEILSRTAVSVRDDGKIVGYDGYHFGFDNSKIVFSVLNAVSYTPPIESKIIWDGERINLKDVVDKARDKTAERSVENEKKKLDKYASYSNYEPKAIDPMAFRRCFKECTSKVLESRTGFVVRQYACPRCGRIWNSSGADVDSRRCSCGTLYSRYNREHDSDYVISYENTELPGNDLLIRRFRIETKHDDVINGRPPVVNEQERIFLSKDKKGNTNMHVFIVTNCGGSTKCEKGKANLPNNDYKSYSLLQNEEEIADVIKRSCMARCGAVEAFGFMAPEYKKCFDPAKITYWRTEAHEPKIELLVKANLCKIAKDVAAGCSWARLSDGTTPAELLHVSKRTIRDAQVYDLSFEEIHSLENLRRIEPGVSAESFNEICRMQMNVGAFTSIMQDYGVKFDRIMEFLQQAYNYQCIEKNDALNIWMDYLRMAARLGYSLADKEIKFPSSLKKAHDVAVFAYNSIKDQVDEEVFSEQAKKNAKALEYSYEDYFAVVPRSTKDVIAEATAQKNCLRSYINRIKDGNTRVVFIRKKEEPDKSYVTAEVSTTGRILQLKGYCNSNPTESGFHEFVQHWMSSKGLTH